MNIISLLNGTAVGIFGIILSIAFCDIAWTGKKILHMSVCMTMIMLVQGILFFLLGEWGTRLVYPLITHLPLVIVLVFFSKNICWGIISVLTAYLCCQLRRWIALLVTAVLDGGEMMQDITEIVVTLPLLLFLLRFVAPAMRSGSHDIFSIQCQFGIIPALYYVFDYVTQIYTDSFSKGEPVIVEFMPFVCSAAYLMFVLQIMQEKWARNQLEQSQECLNLQVTQAVREIEVLREAQQRTSAYRHDLLHHMQYLSSCIENKQTNQALAYMKQICSEIEAHKVTVYCKNEAANLIFSAYVKRAQQYGISIQIQAQISHNIVISESDLCVLLSNALENAIHACQDLLAEGKHGMIEVQAYQKKEKLFLQITNSCGRNIIFRNGIPVTNRPGHGIGIRSICTLVEQYKGIYTFTVKDDQFILRVSI